MSNTEFESRIKRYEEAGMTHEKATDLVQAIDSLHEIAKNPRPLTDEDRQWLRAISSFTLHDLFTEFR